jgi:hypothetical protein
MKYDMTEEEIDEQIKITEQQFNDVMNMEVACYESVVKKQKLLTNLKKQIDSLVCVLEVEHFLENGPNGQDPE